MPFDYLHRLFFNPAHDGFDFFRVEPFVHRGVTGKIRKDDGGLAAFAFG